LSKRPRTLAAPDDSFDAIKASTDSSLGMGFDKSLPESRPLGKTDCAEDDAWTPEAVRRSLAPVAHLDQASLTLFGASLDPTDPDPSLVEPAGNDHVVGGDTPRGESEEAKRQVVGAVRGSRHPLPSLSSSAAFAGFSSKTKTKTGTPSSENVIRNLFPGRTKWALDVRLVWRGDPSNNPWPPRGVDPATSYYQVIDSDGQLATVYGIDETLSSSSAPVEITRSDLGRLCLHIQHGTVHPVSTTHSHPVLSLSFASGSRLRPLTDPARLRDLPRDRFAFVDIPALVRDSGHSRALALSLQPSSSRRAFSVIVSNLDFCGILASVRAVTVAGRAHDGARPAESASGYGRASLGSAGGAGAGAGGGAGAGAGAGASSGGNLVLTLYDESQCIIDFVVPPYIATVQGLEHVHTFRPGDIVGLCAVQCSSVGGQMNLRARYDTRATLWRFDRSAADLLQDRQPDRVAALARFRDAFAAESRRIDHFLSSDDSVTDPLFSSSGLAPAPGGSDEKEEGETKSRKDTSSTLTTEKSKPAVTARDLTAWELIDHVRNETLRPLLFTRQRLAPIVACFPHAYKPSVMLLRQHVFSLAQIKRLGEQMCASSTIGQPVTVLAAASILGWGSATSVTREGSQLWYDGCGSLEYDCFSKAFPPCTGTAPGKAEAYSDWLCARCHTHSELPRLRWSFDVIVGDHTASLSLRLSDPWAANVLGGLTPRRLLDLKEESEDAYRQALGTALGSVVRQWAIRIEVSCWRPDAPSTSSSSSSSYGASGASTLVPLRVRNQVQGIWKMSEIESHAFARAALGVFPDTLRSRLFFVGGSAPAPAAPKSVPSL
jgi:hypothetical protein